MNAVMRREVDAAESSDMSQNENDSVSVQVAELRSDVRHLQSDVTDIKTDLRATNHKVDQIKDSLASAKLWAIGLLVTQVGSLLYVMARGFKWLWI
jgi:outer membrane murein-binding lipoprotein Lpp